MQENSNRTEEGLVRVIGTRVLGAGIVNSVVGAGIFVLPGIVAVQLGASALIAYLVCSIAVALVFLCYAEVGSRTSRSGGTYAYIEDAFGPFAGFVASILLWFGWNVISDAAIAAAMLETLKLGFPILGEPIPRAIFIVAVFGLLALMNVIGVRSGVGIMVFNTVAKLVPLLLVAVGGLFFLNWDFLVPTHLPSLQEIGAASLILIFAFTGAETPLGTSGEIENPPKTIPRAFGLGLSGVLLLYVWLQTVAQGTLGPELGENASAPLSATAQVIFGDWGAKLLLAGAAISMFGTISGDILSTPRVIFATARDGLLPKPLAKVHPRFQTPYVAIIFLATFACALALSGTFKQLAVISSAAILILYMGVSLAVVQLRRKQGHPGPGEFKLPGGMAIPILSCVTIIWLLSQLTREEGIGVGLLLVAIVVLFGIRKVTWGRSSNANLLD